MQTTKKMIRKEITLQYDGGFCSWECEGLQQVPGAVSYCHCIAYELPVRTNSPRGVPERCSKCLEENRYEGLGVK
ncbi:hypothetical protein E2P64_06500 [Candidatus Bathyarchaeota archaeon]|nr:hypothetical protein E2P64_06500 [Candidatus Bathyarchaeota archaeon]